MDAVTAGKPATAETSAKAVTKSTAVTPATAVNTAAETFPKQQGSQQHMEQGKRKTTFLLSKELV